MRYDSRIAVAVVAFVLNAIHHRFSETMEALVATAFPGDDRGGDFVPSWEIDPLHMPYMGNLSCMFEVAHWDLESHRRPIPSNVERRRECGMLRFRPYRDWVPPEPAVVFDRLPHDATIYMLGDSIGNQHAVDFLCYLASASQIVHADVERSDSASWCPNEDECEVEYSRAGGRFTGIGAARVTFRGLVGNRTKDIHVAPGSGNFGAYNEKKNRPRFIRVLNRGKKGDVFVINGGVHYRSKEKLISDIDRIKPAMISAMGRGARVVWRETTAAHFNGTNGYYSTYHSELCSPASLINETASYDHYNGGVTSKLTSVGIHVLKVHRASYLYPEWCHIGGAKKDCLHFLMQGGGMTFYFSEALLKYIEEEY